MKRNVSKAEQLASLISLDGKSLTQCQRTLYCAEHEGPAQATTQRNAGGPQCAETLAAGLVKKSAAKYHDISDEFRNKLLAQDD